MGTASNKELYSTNLNSFQDVVNQQNYIYTRHEEADHLAEVRHRPIAQKDYARDEKGNPILWCKALKRLQPNFKKYCQEKLEK